MNPDANNETPGPSFDFTAAEQQFDDVEMPTLDRELGPAERQIARQINQSIEVLETGLRSTLEHVEALSEIDFEAVMLNPDLAESACDFSNVVAAMAVGLAPYALGAIAARHEFGAIPDDDLPESA